MIILLTVPRLGTQNFLVCPTITIAIAKLLAERGTIAKRMATSIGNEDFEKPLHLPRPTSGWTHPASLECKQKLLARRSVRSLARSSSSYPSIRPHLMT